MSMYATGNPGICSEFCALGTDKDLKTGNVLGRCPAI